MICKRGLELEEDDGFPTVPMATIAELEALLGEYQPLSSLGSMDITLPSMDSECSIANVPLLQILEKDTLPLPDTLAVARQHSGNDVYRSRTSHRFFRWQGGFGERRRGHQWSGEIVVEQRP